MSKAILSTISREFNTRADKSDLFIKKHVDEQKLQNELAQQESMRMRNQVKLPRREAGPPNHHDDKVDSDQ